MSWKPCRGGRIMLDKSIEISHNSYFDFLEATTIKEKTKIAFRWLKAEEYLGNKKSVISFLGENFIQQSIKSKETYKPFIKYINELKN